MKPSDLRFSKSQQQAPRYPTVDEKRDGKIERIEKRWWCKV
jgi:hypothetical protein